MISDEPWILDQVANEERLNMTFDELFSSEKNTQLGIFFPNVDKVAWLAKYPELNNSADSF